MGYRLMVWWQFKRYRKCVCSEWSYWILLPKKTFRLIFDFAITSITLSKFVLQAYFKKFSSPNTYVCIYTHKYICIFIYIYSYVFIYYIYRHILVSGAMSVVCRDRSFFESGFGGHVNIKNAPSAKMKVEIFKKNYWTRQSVQNN